MVVGAIMHFERVALRSTFRVDTLVDSEYLEVVRATYSPILQHWSGPSRSRQHPPSRL